MTMSLYSQLLKGHFENIVEIFGNIYYCLHKIDNYTKNFCGMSLSPLWTVFGGHWRPTGVKMHIFVRQGFKGKFKENPYVRISPHIHSSWADIF